MSNNQTNGQGDSIEQLRKQMEDFQTVIREHDTRLNHLQSSAFQLGNFYLVFQGVILGAIVNSAKVFTCSDSWLLISLSLLPACPNLVALYLIGREYINTISHRDDCWNSYDELNAELVRLQLQKPTTSSTFSPSATQGQPSPASAPGQPSHASALAGIHVDDSSPAGTHVDDSSPAGTHVDDSSPAGTHVDGWRKLKHMFLLFVCLAFFLGVSAIMVVACRKILCRTRHL
ncbi:hypothetical protein ACFXTN_015480 [Malus domestica]